MVRLPFIGAKTQGFDPAHEPALTFTAEDVEPWAKAAAARGWTLEHWVRFTLALGVLADSHPETVKELMAERAIEKLRSMTPAEIFDLSVSAGIHNPDGTLTPEYGGTDPATKPTTQPAGGDREKP